MPEGYAGLRADEFIPVGRGATVVGVYWMDESGQRAESALFQVAHMRDGRIVQLDDYRTRKRALRAAKSSRS